MSWVLTDNETGKRLSFCLKDFSLAITLGVPFETMYNGRQSRKKNSLIRLMREEHGSLTLVISNLNMNFQLSSHAPSSGPYQSAIPYYKLTFNPGTYHSLFIHFISALLRLTVINNK